MWGQGINHDILIFIAAITAVISFHLLNFSHNRATYQRILKDKALWPNLAKVVGTTTFMWIAGFIIPIVYTPFIFIFSYLGWPSFFGACAMAKSSKKPLYALQATMIAITFCLFYIINFRSYPLLKIIGGVIITLLTGLSLYLYLRASKNLNAHGLNSRQILALRYWLLLVLPLVLISYKHEFNLISLTIIGKGIVIGMITLVLPLYFGQLCIEHFGSDKFSLAMGFTPILTFLFQWLNIGAALASVLIALTLALAIALPLIINNGAQFAKAHKLIKF